MYCKTIRWKEAALRLRHRHVHVDDYGDNLSTLIAQTDTVELQWLRIWLRWMVAHNAR